MERDITWREALATVLLLGGAGVWLWDALHEQQTGAAVVWSIGAAALVLAAWAVARGMTRMIDVVRRSTLLMSLLLLFLLALPLQLADGRASTFTQRLITLGMPLSWCLLLTGLLWPQRKAKAAAATQAKTPAAPTPSADPKRRRRRLKRRRKG